MKRIILFIITLFFLLTALVGAESTREDALKSLSIEEKTVPAYVCGEKIDLKLFIQTKYNDKYISLSDENIIKAFSNLGAEFKISKEDIDIKTFFGDKKISGNKLIAGKEEVRLSPPPFFVRGEAFIHIKHLPNILDCHMSNEGDLIYLDPTFRDIIVTPQKKQTVITIQCSSSFNTKTLILKNPHRFAVDLSNVHLTKEQMALPKREIKNEHIGSIIYGQNKIHPNTVRIVIPTGENIEVQTIKSDRKNEFKLSLTKKTPSPQAIDFPQVKVKKVTTSSSKSKVSISVDLSGPVQYESHRFLSPDNRIILDFHNAILMGKKEDIKINSNLAESVRTAQFQLKPKAIVRTVIDLKNSYDVNFSAPKGQNKLLIEVTDKIVKPDNIALDRSGATAFPKKSKIICIDPGHGGYDPGAINYTLGHKEKDITLKISKKTADILNKRGWNVVMTRTTDRDVSYYGSSDMEELGARVRTAQDMNADVFVSIHCDASANTSVKGISTHWYKKSDQILASKIHAQMLKEIKNKDRKTQQNRFYVLSNTKMPAVLIETGFITNSEDIKYLTQAGGIEKVAKAIADGIEAYFKSQK